MTGILSKYVSKIFIQQWTIGIAQATIKDIIKNKLFDPEIKWFPIQSKNKFSADPFLYKTKEGNYAILIEEYSFSSGYGIISLMLLDKYFNTTENKVLLDTNSHLSYPFIFSEYGKTYVFPEASQSGKLSCYEYDIENKSFIFLKDLIELPLLDSTIFKYNNKYWLFATLNGIDADNKLYIYFSDSLLGTYIPHAKNPVKTGITSTRPAGNLIEVDGVFYRPSQNSKYTYGGSITINRLLFLDESDFKEEFYMSIYINGKRKSNRGMHGIHTLNCVDDTIVVDGTKWRFSLTIKLKQISDKLFRRDSR